MEPDRGEKALAPVEVLDLAAPEKEKAAVQAADRGRAEVAARGEGRVAVKGKDPAVEPIGRRFSDFSLFDGGA